MKDHNTHKLLNDFAKKHGFTATHRGKANRQELYDFLAKDLLVIMTRGLIHI